MKPVEVEHLWKRFQLTRSHPRGGSLRDTIPATLGRLFGRNGSGDESFWALRDISFSVAPGESLGIIGPNGAGKTTILKLLSGILRADRGAVRVNGRAAALIELGAGFHPDLTGRENVYLNGAILGLRKREIDKKFDEIVEFSGIAEFIDTPVKRYSSGMAMRLGFAVAAHTEPDVLLVDEVLAVGDLAFQQRCLGRIRELRRKGLPIVFVSHNLDAVESVCDRVLLLDRGQTVLEGAPRAVVETYEHRQRRAVEPTAEPECGAGSGQRVEILAVTTHDAEGLLRTDFETGEPLTVRLEFRAPEPVTDVAFGVAIHSAEGVYCYGTNTALDDLRFGRLQGRGAIDIVYDRLDLLANRYRITAGVFDRASHVPYALQKDISAFRVRHARKDQGLVHLSHRWHLVMDGRDAGAARGVPDGDEGP